MTRDAGLTGEDIRGFLFDDANEEKLAAHGLARRQVEQILHNEYIRVRNRAERRGTHLIIGTDNGGRCIAVPVQAQAVTGRHKPSQGVGSKDSEQRRLHVRR